MSDQHWSASAETVSVAREPHTALAVLRVRAPSEADLASLEVALQTGLPSTPNSIAMGAAKALWLAPSEWLIVGSAAERSAVVAAGAGARAVHLADVTDGRVVYVVSGPRSADLLAKGCTLDFHDRAFPIGACAQSALAQVFAIVERTADTQFHVYADTSLAHHLELWFVDALKEFELRNLN